MRVALAFLAILAAAAGAEPLPNPQACANYTEVKTGSDADCDVAIAKETDPAVKSVLLFRRAYIIIDRQDFDTYLKAQADLDEAIRLLPTNWKALHERAYLLNEYGRWADALKDMDAQIALQPQAWDGYQERSMARFWLGDLKGFLDDRNTAVLLRPDYGPLYSARADARMWTGDFDGARADIEKAAALADPNDKNQADIIAERRSDMAALTKTSGSAKACEDADKKADYKRDTLIGDCTRAFLDAATSEAKANALTVRAAAWLHAGNDGNATTDYRIAVALAPNNGMWHSNLGFAYMRARHSQAAVTEFDKSIELKPDFYNYAGRAAAKFNIKDVDGAFPDAKKSFEIKPNALALIVLGDCVYARTTSYQEAKGYWIAAWRMGDHGDAIVKRLNDAGVPVPPPDDAQSANPH
jgi:tetratricopeptide (TPR) repeat protein